MRPPLSADPLVSGPGVEYDRLYAVRAMAQRLDRLRAADATDLVDPADMCRGHHDRLDLAARRRGHHHDALHPRDLGGEDVHQHRRGIGGVPAGDIDTGRIDRAPARAEPDRKSTRLNSNNNYAPRMPPSAGKQPR